MREDEKLGRLGLEDTGTDGTVHQKQRLFVEGPPDEST